MSDNETVEQINETIDRADDHTASTLKIKIADLIPLAKKSSPYGDWCHDPLICAGKGYCPRDPTCGD